MSDKTMPIGVFDSGVGGITVLAELKKSMPHENFIYFGDSKNAPYGTKDEAEILKCSEDAVTRLIDMGAKAIVIACNTATSVAALSLRENFSIPIIGIEPAVKPAVMGHKGGKVLVMATPVTLKKEKFTHLMNSYCDISEIIPLPCPKLVEIIEKGVTEGAEIEEYLSKLFRDIDVNEIDAVVLGCTHYPFIKSVLRKFFNQDTDIIDGGYGTAKETARRLGNANMLNDNTDEGYIKFISSMESEDEISLMKAMYKSQI